VVTGPGEITAGTLRIAAGTGDLAEGSEILWCIRPDRITAGGHGYGAVVLDVADMGTYISITAQLTGGPDLRIRTAGAAGLERGDSCRLDLDPEFIALWPAGDEFRARQPS
jgi:TOBE domain